MPYPGRPSPPNGPGLYRTPAFILSLAALCGLLPARPTQCAPSALRRSVCGETMSTPGALGTRYSYNPPVLVAPASLIKGRSSSPIRLWPFALSRSYAAIIAAPLLGKREQGWGFLRGSGPLSCSAPPQCPKPSLDPTPLWAHNTQRYGHLLGGDLG